MADAHAASTPAGRPVDQLTDGPGVARFDPADPAAPAYELLSRLRSPLSLREIMIGPVRSGYIGQGRTIDPALPPPPAATLFPDVAIEEIDTPSPDGPVRCQVYRPHGLDAATPAPVLLYVHGGGFMVGRSEDTEFLTRKLAWENRLLVVSANYRLAPEWPFPAGLDDCLSVYRWLLHHGAEIGADPRRVGFAGDSSGANFAATMGLRARDAGLPWPRVSVMLGPVCDFRFERYESFNRLAPLGIVYDAAFAGFLRGAYARYDEWDHPHVSPIRAGLDQLRGFPPAFVAVGTADPMVDSATAFVARLREAGNADAALFVGSRMPHGFYFFPRLFHEEEEAYAAIRGFLGRHLAMTETGGRPG